MRVKLELNRVLDMRSLSKICNQNKYLYFHDQVRHFYKKLYFNPGLFGDQDTNVKDDVGQNTNKMMEDSVREIRQRLNIE